jgi:thiol-disulfide isomerase/thioredoxin
MRFFNSTKMNARFLLTSAFIFVFCLGAVDTACAQKTKTNGKAKAAEQIVDPNLPKVTQIAEADFSTIIKKSSAASRPVLVNFWATWCDPCREEFPDLVKIDAEYRAKGLDFIVISMDDLADMKTTVPKFLGEVKATMPAYLLMAKDEGAFLESITAVADKNDAVVGLPVTVLFDATGKIAYKRSGKIKSDVLRAELDKLFPAVQATATNGK